MLNNCTTTQALSLEQKEYLLSKLNKLEKDFNVKIIYAAVSGSRLFGLNTSSSDFDVKFIYVDQLDWYFNPTKKGYTISFIEGDCDFIGFGMEKAITSVIKSSGTFLEWVRSDIILIEQPDFLKELLPHIETFYSPIKVYNYYNHITRKIYINIKLIVEGINNLEKSNFFLTERRKLIKYFLLFVRSSLSLHFCHSFGAIPIKFNDLLKSSFLDAELKESIKELVYNYRTNIKFCIENIDDFNIMMEQVHAFNKGHVLNYQEKPYVSPSSIVKFHKKIIFKQWVNL